MIDVVMVCAGVCGHQLVFKKVTVIAVYVHNCRSLKCTVTFSHKVQ